MNEQVHNIQNARIHVKELQKAIDSNMQKNLLA